MDRDKAVEFINDLLRAMVERGGSDLFVTPGAPPSIKVDGIVTHLTEQPLSATHTELLVRSIMSDRQLREYEETQESNFAISVPGLRRFRISAFMQKNSYAMVLRTIQTTIPTIKELQLPSIAEEISMSKRGLVLVVGATGSGKSSTLAALIGHRNEHSQGHIITIEDPIEFVHDHRSCLITQREIGVDTESYQVALKNTLRQAPDVILLGEIRDRETMEYAIAFAETGHLCVSTLHSNSTNQALDRIINFFPEERRSQLLMDLSLNLRGIMSQRLVRRADGDGRVPAVEIMINSPLMSDMILKGRIDELKELVKNSTELGMQTFDQALFALFERGVIDYREALRNADSVNDLRLRIKLESKRARSSDIFEGTDKIELQEKPTDDGLI
ncbi:MAG TPA: PilT/PilU family type 4a pilus ATPase [Gammaproteobacteria bacterium]|nr:PilT/PilU family type 4a pilus ATPase [Gammaproteobacteria bacterium]